jgi:hypothetical protein
VNVDGRTRTEVAKIRSQPLLSASATYVTQMGKKIPICIVLGGDAEVFHERVCLDRMDEHCLYLVAQRASVDELVGEGKSLSSRASATN